MITVSCVLRSLLVFGAEFDHGCIYPIVTRFVSVNANGLDCFTCIGTIEFTVVHSLKWHLISSHISLAITMDCGTK